MPISALCLTNIIETFIDGDFNGWEGNTIVKLQNGQIWQLHTSERFVHSVGEHPYS